MFFSSSVYRGTRPYTGLKNQTTYKKVDQHCLNYSLWEYIIHELFRLLHGWFSLFCTTLTTLNFFSSNTIERTQGKYFGHLLSVPRNNLWFGNTLSSFVCIREFFDSSILPCSGWGMFRYIGRHVNLGSQKLVSLNDHFLRWFMVFLYSPTIHTQLVCCASEAPTKYNFVSFKKLNYVFFSEEKKLQQPWPLLSLLLYI